MRTGFFLVVFFLTFSCSTEEREKSRDLLSTIRQVKVLEDFIIPKEDITSLQQLGYSGSNARILEIKDYKTDEWSVYYLKDNHIEIKKTQLNALLNLKKTTESSRNNLVYNNDYQSQYRTTNLVSANFSTIKIIGLHINNGGIRNGLIKAVENYNKLDISLNFSVEFRSPFGLNDINQAIEDADILVQQSVGEIGGRAGFPFANGKPYDFITISGATGTAGEDVAEHVATHEIGHCIGLRHTDYFSRGSCDIPGNGGQSNVGAIHIPGTPARTGIDSKSIMQACFNQFIVDGEFTNFDRIALETLY